MSPSLLHNSFDTQHDWLDQTKSAIISYLYFLSHIVKIQHLLRGFPFKYFHIKGDIYTL